MEELRSTEILDKEIESDARKKAEKILKKTEEECKKIIDSVKDKVESAKKEKSAFYQKKLESFKADTENSFPLEKQRFLVSFIQNSFSKNINEFLNSMSLENRIDLVINKSKSELEKIKSQKVCAFVYGFDLNLSEQKLRKIFGENLVKVEKTEFNKIIEEELLGLTFKEGIILETQNKTIRFRMTLPEIFGQIENDYREELFNALFDGRIFK